MEQLLIKFEANWADEMDVEGMFVMSSDDWDKYNEVVEKYFEEADEMSYCIGTNEEIEFYSAEEVLDCYTVLCGDMAAEGLLAMKKHLPIGFCGPDFDYFDEDEYEERPAVFTLDGWDEIVLKERIDKSIDVSLSVKDECMEIKREYLTQNGYEVTYRGKFGITMSKKKEQ